MNRGEVWLAKVGRKKRPVLILTRDEVIDVRANVTVAEITTTIRGLGVEVVLEDSVGLDRESVINCDGIHTVAKSTLVERVGEVSSETLADTCSAVSYAIAC